MSEFGALVERHFVSHFDDKPMAIINLTQHLPVAGQVWERGCATFVLTDEHDRVKRLLTFDEAPTAEELLLRAKELACIAEESCCKAALIGGAPYLMGPLENALRKKGILPVYSFSRRKSVKKTFPDGSVEKRIMFRHVAYVSGAC